MLVHPNVQHSLGIAGRGGCAGYMTSAEWVSCDVHLGLWEHEPRQQRCLEEVVEEAQAAETAAKDSSAQIYQRPTDC